MDLIIKNIVLNAGNSGTFARLILGLLVKSPYYIKLIEIKVCRREILKESYYHCKKIGANFKVNDKKLYLYKLLGLLLQILLTTLKIRGLHNAKAL